MGRVFHWLSETLWKTATDNVLRKYGYQYDHLNRLLEGNYTRENASFLDSDMAFLEGFKPDLYKDSSA